ncbi:MAG: zinc ribbon domain-containing protein [Clostridia bacterium]|nr:zinc ribbon domain-containing protein [Clostridia bacterium]
MADIFGGFGSLIKGLSGFMPQDDPAVKLMNAKTSIADLQKEQNDIYAQIGKRALQQYGDGFCTDLTAKLDRIAADLQEAQQLVAAAEEEKAKKEAAEKEAADRATCPNCGTRNPDGLKFCQECGSRLGVVTKVTCPRCGNVNEAGTRFCGECGNRLGD